METPVDLIAYLTQVESSNNPLAHNKESGARGLTQITPIAWKDLVRVYPEKYAGIDYESNIFDPNTAYEAGNDYLKIVKGYLKHYGMEESIENMLAAYNWGIGNLRDKGIEKAPKETRDYITKIKALGGY